MAANATWACHQGGLGARTALLIAVRGVIVQVRSIMPSHRVCIGLHTICALLSESVVNIATHGDAAFIIVSMLFSAHGHKSSPTPAGASTVKQSRKLRVGSNNFPMPALGATPELPRACVEIQSLADATLGTHSHVRRAAIRLAGLDVQDWHLRFSGPRGRALKLYWLAFKVALSVHRVAGDQVAVAIPLRMARIIAVVVGDARWRKPFPRFGVEYQIGVAYVIHFALLGSKFAQIALRAILCFDTGDCGFFRSLALAVPRADNRNKRVARIPIGLRRLLAQLFCYRHHRF